jgi:hypothetical protein
MHNEHQFYETLNERFEMEALGDQAELSIHLFHVNSASNYFLAV